MKGVHHRLVVLFLFFGVVPAASQTPPKREFRGAWVASVAKLDWPTRAGAATQTQKNDLVAIFQIRPECDALYGSNIEPWSRWLTGTQGNAPSPLWDPLQFAVEGDELIRSSGVPPGMRGRICEQELLKGDFV